MEPKIDPGWAGSVDCEAAPLLEVAPRHREHQFFMTFRKWLERAATERWYSFIHSHAFCNNSYAPEKLRKMSVLHIVK